jgi:molybdate transport system regulatory protein
MATQSPLAASLTLGRGTRGAVGSSRIALLEAIRDHGSINAAAKAVGFTYKGAWDAVQALNNLFDRPVVVAHAGGAAGGTTRVTDLGEALIGAFRFVNEELDRAFGGLETQVRKPGGVRPNGFLWSLSMRTSARNALAGTVDKVTDGAVNAEVSLDIGHGHKIIAIVTRDSVEDLDLKPGRRALALIKSSFVILVPGERALRTSARNCLTGTIVRREDGAVNSEVVLELSPGRTVTAIVTRESAENLDLAVGARASALIKASHVILVVDDAE